MPPPPPPSARSMLPPQHAAADAISVKCEACEAGETGVEKIWTELKGVQVVRVCRGLAV